LAGVDTRPFSMASASFSAKALFPPEAMAAKHLIISPTLKRTEGRVPLWGSEFTTQVAHYRGGHQKSLLG
jgi:hypothetical protein